MVATVWYGVVPNPDNLSYGSNRQDGDQGI